MREKDWELRGEEALGKVKHEEEVIYPAKNDYFGDVAAPDKL